MDREYGHTKGVFRMNRKDRKGRKWRKGVFQTNSKYRKGKKGCSRRISRTGKKGKGCSGQITSTRKEGKGCAKVWQIKEKRFLYDFSVTLGPSNVKQDFLYIPYIVHYSRGRGKILLCTADIIKYINIWNFPQGTFILLYNYMYIGMRSEAH